MVTLQFLLPYQSHGRILIDYSLFPIVHILLTFQSFGDYVNVTVEREASPSGFAMEILMF